MSEKKKEKPKRKAVSHKKSEEAVPEEVSLVLSPSVVSDIVRQEVLNAPGVTEIAASSFIGRSRDISVSEETSPDGEVCYRVEVHLFVEFGTNCGRLKDALAKRVATSVKKMTGREVVSLVVHVDGVKDPVPDEEVEETPETPMIDY